MCRYLSLRSAVLLAAVAAGPLAPTGAMAQYPGPAWPQPGRPLPAGYDVILPPHASAPRWEHDLRRRQVDPTGGLIRMWRCRERCRAAYQACLRGGSVYDERHRWQCDIQYSRCLSRCH